MGRMIGCMTYRWKSVRKEMAADTEVRGTARNTLRLIGSDDPL